MEFGIDKKELTPILVLSYDTICDIIIVHTIEINSVKESVNYFSRKQFY